jgi:hypothetical protein
MPRVITADAINAFLNRREINIDNTKTWYLSILDAWYLELFGNNIAQLTHKDELFITDAGHKTNTTKERLNGLPGVSISQRQGVWYLNGKEWDGEWTNVAEWDANINNLITNESTPMNFGDFTDKVKELVGDKRMPAKIDLKSLNDPQAVRAGMGENEYILFLRKRKATYIDNIEVLESACNEKDFDKLYAMITGALTPEQFLIGDRLDYDNGEVVVWNGDEPAIGRIKGRCRHFHDSYKLSETDRYSSCNFYYLRPATPKEIKLLEEAEKISGEPVILAITKERASNPLI